MERVQGKERETGPVEYKLTLAEAGSRRIEELTTQMEYRIREGGGEAFYEVGVTDEGELLGLPPQELEKTLEVLREVAKRIGAELRVLRKVEGKRGVVAEVHVRKVLQREPISLTIPVIGNVDSGKSTLLSVLAFGELDDGAGAARAKIARHKHELMSGRTSSVTTVLLGFSDGAEVVNRLLPHPSEDEVYTKSSKVICFVDLAGHYRYLKTTLKGICSHEPDYGMLVVSANAGLIGTAREQFGIMQAIRTPVFAVVTKTDLVGREMVKRVLRQLWELAEMPSVDKIPMLVKSRGDLVVAARHMRSGRVMPVFLVSSKTGEGIGRLVEFLSLLPPRRHSRLDPSAPFRMYVEDKFSVRGVGTVVYGLVLEGTVRVGDRVWIGPVNRGYTTTAVKSIQIHRVNARRASSGQLACLAIDLDYSSVEKGMVVLDISEKPLAVEKIRARILVLHHPTTIRRGYQAVLHAHSIRETVKFTWTSKEPLRTGDMAKVDLEFMYNPVYIRRGEKFFLREASTRAVGVVEEVYAREAS